MFEMFDCSIIKQHGFHDSVIEKLSYSDRGDFCLQGVFDEWEYTDNTGCKYYYFRFSDIDELEQSIDEADYVDSDIIEFNIDSIDDKYNVSIAIDDVGLDKRFELIKFTCKKIYHSFYKYRGKSYKNMYNDTRYQKILAEMQEAYNEKYLLRTETELLDIGDGYTIKEEVYNNPNLHTYIERSFLIYDDKIQFQYDCIYRRTLKPVIIKHQNGRQYLLFKIDLYGLCVYDLESKQVFNYIPEGYQHHYDNILGESFIITNIHYDIATNLIAYEGCYWAAPNDIMVGDFSNPMDFEKELKSIHDIVDPEYELYDDIDFSKWEDGKLHVLLDRNTIKVLELNDMS